MLNFDDMSKTKNYKTIKLSRFIYSFICLFNIIIIIILFIIIIIFLFIYFFPLFGYNL